MWSSITGLLEEIKKCERADATTAALALSFICIDAMSYLALPAGREKQGRADFVKWVDQYLNGDKDQLYAYRGIDVYGARCALLHNYGSEADYHDANPDAIKFGYHDGGMHAFNASEDPRLVIIGTASFFNDVLIAVGDFIKECATDASLRERVESRLPRVLATFPFTE